MKRLRALKTGMNEKQKKDKLKEILVITGETFMLILLMICYKLEVDVLS